MYRLGIWYWNLEIKPWYAPLSPQQPSLCQVRDYNLYLQVMFTKSCIRLLPRTLSHTITINRSNLWTPWTVDHPHTKYVTKPGMVLTWCMPHFADGCKLKHWCTESYCIFVEREWLSCQTVHMLLEEPQATTDILKVFNVWQKEIGNFF